MRQRIIIGVPMAYRYPHFLHWGIQYPTFQDEKVKNLLSPAVNRSDLRRLNYNKTIFGRGAPPGPRCESSRRCPRPHRVGWGAGYFLPVLLPFRLGAQERLVLLLNSYTHFLDQSYAPVPANNYNLHVHKTKIVKYIDLMRYLFRFWFPKVILL